MTSFGRGTKARQIPMPVRFDPRQLTPAYLYFRIHPQRLQAWREANELKDRDLMHQGDWVT